MRLLGKSSDLMLKNIDDLEKSKAEMTNLGTEMQNLADRTKDASLKSDLSDLHDSIVKISDSDTTFEGLAMYQTATFSLSATCTPYLLPKR